MDQFDAIRTAAHRQVLAACKARGQLTLGTLTDALGKEPPDNPVYFDVWGLAFSPTGFDSYRGYYDHLALGFKEQYPPKVSEVLEWCRATDGATYQGWKGGDYTMGRDTPVWVANAGHSNGVCLIGIDRTDWCTVLRTATTDDSSYQPQAPAATAQLINALAEARRLRARGPGSQHPEDEARHMADRVLGLLIETLEALTHLKGE